MNYLIVTSLNKYNIKYINKISKKKYKIITLLPDTLLKYKHLGYDVKLISEYFDVDECKNIYKKTTKIIKNLLNS